jgi:phosphate transport system substrate-binding protein
MGMTMKKKLLLALCAFLLLGACSRKQHLAEAGIQIKGSDTIVGLVQVWAENYVAIYPDAAIGVTGGGSGTAFAALVNNTCDIGMSSRKIEAKEEQEALDNGIELQEVIIGYDGLVILVNKDNPVSELTLSQIRDIFMRNITNWKEVGGDDLEIVILSRESNSGTHLFFKEHVLRMNNPVGKEEFSPRALLMPSSQAIFDEVVHNPHAIGYVGMGFSNDEVKVLKVSLKEGSPYIAPTISTVLSGAYPITRPLFLYIKKDPRLAVKNFIEFTLSDRGQEIVAEVDFVPLRQLKK